MGRARDTPLVAQLFQAAAAALDLDQGAHALVLRFVDGELLAWGVSGDTRPPAELAAFDGRVTWLLPEADPRTQLEAVLRRMVSVGHVPPEGQRSVTFRLDERGRVRWFEAHQVRIPSSVLGRGFDETAGSR